MPRHILCCRHLVVPHAVLVLLLELAAPLKGERAPSLVLPFTRNRSFVDLVHCESSSLVPLSVSSAAAAFTLAFLDGALLLDRLVRLRALAAKPGRQL